MVKRPIDILRDDPIDMEVGTDNDRSAIVEMCVLGGAMHVIKAKGIYRMQLADDVDPERKNPSVPNTQQQVLAFGADCDPVWKMLLTAKRLFESKLLGDAFDYQRPIDLTFEALKDVIAMQEMRLQLEAELTAVSESLASLAPKNRGLSVPSVGGVRTRVETFLQKADHAIGDLFEIAKQFYPGQVGKKWSDSLLELVKEKYGADAQFTKFVVEVLPFVKFVRNARNCVEHPKSRFGKS